MSDDIAIRVNGLGKKYRIAHETAPYKTLGETITRAVKSPFRRLTGGVPARTTEEFWALRDVSFEVKKGEVVGIIGRNGAGKSTLLKILSRITTPTEGTVEVHGRIGSLLEVGTGFHPELSGRENIYLSGSILGMKRDEIDTKFDEIVKFAEMEKFLDTPVKRYSSGMYVRLAFAVAAHLEPEILIIDEVLAVGDAAFQKKCLGKMGDVARGGTTVLFVSHNMGAVNQLCSIGIFLSNGSVESSGEINRIVATYQSNSPTGGDSNEIERYRTKGMGKEIFISQISTRDDQSSFRVGEPICLQLQIGSTQQISDASIAMSLFDAVGQCIGTFFSEKSLIFKEGAVDELTLTFPTNCLAPGSYYFGFSVGRGGRGQRRYDFDIVIGMPRITVINSTTDNKNIEWSNSWGRIIFSDVNLHCSGCEQS